MSNTTTNPDPNLAQTTPPLPNPASASTSTSTTTATPTATTPIDALLTHYLTLLDEYTTLRHTLHTLQTRLYQDLARANFAAERGVRRYGSDYYDGRMQAGRRVVGAEGGSGAEPPVTVGDGVGDEDVKEKQPEEEISDAAPGGGDDEKEMAKPVDPLRWFGILTPLPLRQAQGHAIKAVEEIIPRLATLNTAMAAVELEVRRARKKRAKAEKAEEKKLVALEEKMAEVDVNA
ncbi:hypothetical protein F5144DRAFT_549166 [Chaetomium tenue]|uniref:Uncharacterized protein n=1 Tax=Chaetomium tenue TaxID=1854479 RepID=A0ACB7P621_9PEZI|nr:hypothetical protein F5144DRAFT_549166 [Chaetomium globosum]